MYVWGKAGGTRLLWWGVRCQDFLIGVHWDGSTLYQAESRRRLKTAVFGLFQGEACSTNQHTVYT